ncbi:amino acid/amide ABC transporter ATP-binding protein 1, HAAT family [Gemmobacter megaterium]|uniref:Amino acid/amide ABC transporter ATP-binding protein 1, HAAT family n=1 Tax=Gemmobacter megaterium TaxID=1086013 RepID=A0A1N7NAX0_9RHOB|nr:ABC transporter ATP-binding protein [Gemmobacter megaterium]GGE13968.1 ABC transporter ATP-binding protein [Gemmobacter megaterium]SIS95361.1 amino acid/amide ABC transporter ATP-binding protein 1, HAAT family [Gemmobacter megaterium]
MSTPVLSTKGLTRDFGPFRAVDGVSLDIRPGTITGLIGPNGAGKTTFFNLISGALKPSAGQVLLNGQDITGLPPEALFGKGLARTFQIPRPFRRMSLLENVMLAPQGQRGETVLGALFSRAAVRAEEARLRDKAMGILEFMTLGKLADHPAGQISGGQMKLLELARALMGDPAVILLDEPAAGVNPSLTRVLIERIEELNRRGTTFFIIEHDMDFVMRHCDPVIALAEGKVVFEGTAAEAQTNPLLLDAYLGAAE